MEVGTSLCQTEEAIFFLPSWKIQATPTSIINQVPNAEFNIVTQAVATITASTVQIIPFLINHKSNELNSLLKASLFICVLSFLL